MFLPKKIELEWITWESVQTAVCMKTSATKKNRIVTNPLRKRRCMKYVWRTKIAVIFFFKRRHLRQLGPIALKQHLSWGKAQWFRSGGLLAAPSAHPSAGRPRERFQEVRSIRKVGFAGSLAATASWRLRWRRRRRQALLLVISAVHWRRGKNGWGHAHYARARVRRVSSHRSGRCSCSHGYRRWRSHGRAEFCWGRCCVGCRKHCCGVLEAGWSSRRRCRAVVTGGHCRCCQNRGCVGVCAVPRRGKSRS